MQQTTWKQLIQLLLLFGKLENNHLENCLDLCSSSVQRLRTTPSSMKLKQFEKIAKLASNRGCTISLKIGKLTIHSWNYNNIVRMCDNEFKIGFKELSERLGLKYQAFYKRLQRNSISLMQLNKTIEAFGQDLIFSINGNKYLIK